MAYNKARTNKEAATTSEQPKLTTEQLLANKSASIRQGILSQLIANPLKSIDTAEQLVKGAEIIEAYILQPFVDLTEENEE